MAARITDKSEIFEEGFTYLELSILLMIVSILAGAILVGKMMIRTSNLMAFGAQITQYRNAAKLFRDKYQYLPGDMSNAATFWGTSSTGCSAGDPTTSSTGTCNGNGDGFIGPIAYWTGGNVAATAEWMLFWNHLSLAGFISGNYSCVNSLDFNVDFNNPLCMPTLQTPDRVVQIAVKAGTQYPSNSLLPAARQNDKAYFLIAAQGPPGGGILNQPAFSPNDAQWVDSKYDDGVPGTGAIIGSNIGGFRICDSNLNFTSGGQYIGSDSITAYTGSSTDRGCILFWEVDFDLGN
jgi:Tfp pilus assembly major pilin PilA